MDLKPNILLVTSDRQHDKKLRAIDPRIGTPALDRLCLAGRTLVVSFDHRHLLGHRGLIAKVLRPYADPLGAPLVVRPPGAKWKVARPS